MERHNTFCVTTSPAVDRRRFEDAVRWARRWGVDMIPRTAAALSALRRRYSAVLVFESSRVRLVDSVGDVRFSAGIAYRRIEMLHRVARDPLITVAGIERGMAVLDMTLGLGRDALVAASIVGRTGSVVGLEASAALAAFDAAGIPGCPLPTSTRCGGMARIDVIHAEATSWSLATARSFDVALVDPMFDRARRADVAFEMLRRHAWPEPLDDRLLIAALRCARRVVVRVGHPMSLQRLSHAPATVSRSGKTFWAVFEER